MWTRSFIQARAISGYQSSAGISVTRTTKKVSYVVVVERVDGWLDELCKWVKVALAAQTHERKFKL
jgi:hypothetical protein